MNHKVVSQEEWRKARLLLLEKEKDLTHRNDALTKERLALPWVRLEKEYLFEAEMGRISLKELFRGRSQLMIYHFMFGPDYDAGCASCSAIADGFNAIEVHLKNHDVAIAAISRAPFQKLRSYKERMGWSFLWASSFASDFNSDFGVSFTPEEQRKGLEFNYQREPAVDPSRQGRVMPARNNPDAPTMAASLAGTDPNTYARERMGLSSFALEEGTLYHTYSAYARGIEALWSVYPWLDRAPKGRNEPTYWWRRHDEYGAS